MRLSSYKMASIIRCFNLVLGCKSNKYKKYKWILVFLRLKGLIKRLIKKIKVKG